MLPLIDPHGQAEALKSARKHKGWSQRRLAAALEQAARALGQLSELPPAGRQTLIQYISYFENGKASAGSAMADFPRGSSVH
jgi:transcriptional regulator with XRE-family HTH domain